LDIKIAQRYFIESIKQYSFLKPNHQLHQFDKMRCSYVSPIVMSDLITEDHVNKMALNELTQSFIKELSKCLLNTNIFDYIEVKDIDIDFTFLPVLMHKVQSKRYQNVIVSSKMGASIQDSVGYSAYSNSNVVNTSGALYKVGKFFNSDIWIDPYMRYNDNRMIFFNDVFYNIGELFMNENISSNTFAPRTEIILEYKLLTNISEILYVIDDKNDPNYKDYLRIQRDQKIDQIVD
jgi:hypothetical protein